ncbi:MAG: hypothetical protein PHW13_01215 [Methylococcales bacterium]|nr:hypothetical protein [Methylococcales bacterium]
MLALAVAIGVVIFFIAQKQKQHQAINTGAINPVKPLPETASAAVSEIPAPTQESAVSYEASAEADITETPVACVEEDATDEAQIEIETAGETIATEAPLANEATEVAIAAESQVEITAVAAETPAKTEAVAESAKPAAETAAGEKGETLPEDSVLRRHYLSARQAEKAAITNPYPTDSVLRRHNSSKL